MEVKGTFFCVDTWNYAERHIFSTKEAVKRFIEQCESTHLDWSLKAGFFFDGELVVNPEPLTNCQFIDEDGGIDAVLERLEVATGAQREVAA